MKWTWSKGAATTLGDLGNTADGVAHYSLCVYDASANPQPLSKSAVLPGGTCGTTSPKPCWKKAGKTGYKFKDKAGLAKGIQSVSLRSGAAGKAKISINAKGAAVELPAMALTLPARVQLIVHEGARTLCWDAEYTIASKNEPEQFSAKNN
jgi:hypothetical protein